MKLKKKNQFWILKGHKTINSAKEFELDVPKSQIFYKLQSFTSSLDAWSQFVGNMMSSLQKVIF